jgi:hypothetical protein
MNRLLLVCPVLSEQFGTFTQLISRTCCRRIAGGELQALPVRAKGRSPVGQSCHLLWSALSTFAIEKGLAHEE